MPWPHRGDRGGGLTTGETEFLTLKLFGTAAECSAHCRAEGMEIWAVANGGGPGDGAACVRAGVALPPGRRVAVVFGKEGGEVSGGFAVDKRIRYSHRGTLGAGLSMSVATAGAVLLQRLQDAVRGALADGLLGDLGPAETERLRAKWYAALAKTPQQKEEFPQHDPPEPLGDLRMPEELREAMVPKKFVRKRERIREEEAAAAAVRPAPRPPAIPNLDS